MTAPKGLLKAAFGLDAALPLRESRQRDRLGNRVSVLMRQLAALNTTPPCFLLTPQTHQALWGKLGRNLATRRVVCQRGQII